MNKFMKYGGHEITEIHLSATSPPSSALLAQIEASCDLLQHREPGTIVVMRIQGQPGRAADTTTVNPWAEHADLSLIRKWEQAVRRLEKLDAVTIAVAEQVCSIAALEMLLIADYRIACADFQTIVPGAAMWPGMFLYRLVNLIGLARTRRIMLFGANMTAAEAAEIGVIDVIASDVKVGLEAVLESVPSERRGGMAICRRLMEEAGRVSYENALGSHLAACDRALRQTRSPAGDPRCAPCRAMYLGAASLERVAERDAARGE